MPDSPVFEWVSAALERATTFDSLQARGTMRLALRKAGLDAASVDIQGMCATLQHLMPKELSMRKIADGEAICARLVMDLRAANLKGPAPEGQTPEDVFRRMFSSAPKPPNGETS
jgi:hypothetical protein